MGLERGDVGVLVEAVVPVVAHVRGAGGNVEVLVVADVGRDELALGHDALRIELQADAGAVGGLDPDRGVVHVELDLRPRLDEAAGAVGEDVAVLAEGVLVEERVVVVVRLGVGVARHRVVDDREPLDGGLGLDRPDPAVLGQARVGVEVTPPVWGLGGDHERLGNLDDPVGLADLPLGDVAELARRRQVLGVAAGRARVHPSRDGLDLLVAQRVIVLEPLHADVLVDVPRRHGPGDHLLADRAGPRPRLLVGQQRHRRDGAGAVALLARALQNRRDVPGEGELVRLVLRLDGGRRGQETERGDQGDGESRAAMLSQ